MGIAQNRTGKLSVLARARRFGFGRNPLRRGVDRIESAIVLGSILAALLMIPLAAAAGTAVRQHNEAAGAARRAVLTRTQARTLEAAPGPVGESQTSSLVQVTWSDPAGARREGRTDVPVGTRAGTEVPIWLDRSGAITTSPSSSGDSIALASVAGVGVAMASLAVIIGLARLAVVPLDRRRMRNWAAEWRQVSQRWRHYQE
jgi:hypothetical protein